MASEDKEYSFEGVEIPQANTSNDGDGGVSCSIEETNRIRMLLGLKPLQVGNDDPVVNREREAVDRLKKLREEQATKQNAEKLKQQIEDARTKRLAQPKHMEKTLGDAADDEEDDTAAWVRKSREKEKTKAEEKAKQEEKRRAKLLIEQEDDDDEDEDDADNRRAAAKSRYNKSSLRGMKIGHDVTALAANEGVILTLADTSVLANGDVNDEEDVLENINMTELEKHQDAVRKSKMKAYNPYADEDENGSSNKGILSHYDEDQKKKFTLIGEDGSVEAKQKKMANIRARLQASMTAQADVKPITISDQPQEKPVNGEEFRQTAKKADEKKKKLRKKRMTTEEIHESVLKSIEENADVDEEKTSDVMAASMEFDSLDKATKQKKLIQRTKKVTNSILGEDEDDEPEDDALSASLARARRLAALTEKKTARPEDAILSTLRVMSKGQSNASQENQKDTGVIFTATQEYIRKVGFENQESDKESEEDGDDNKQSSTSRRDDSKMADEKASENGDNSGDDNDDMHEGQSESESDDGEGKQDDTSLPMEEPDLNRGGLAAALALARQRGDLSKQLYGGRTKDKIDESYGPSSTGKKEIRLEQRDEFGRILTPKEAFRALSYKFHGRRPGKRAQEKRTRKLEEQMKLEKIANDGTKSVTMELLKVQQDKAQVPYMVLSVGNKTVLGSMPSKDDDGHNGDAAIPLEKTAKMSFSMKRKEGGGASSSKKSK